MLSARRQWGRRRPMIYDRVAAAVRPDGRTAGQRLLMDDRAAGGGGSGEHGRPPAAFRCLINYPLLPLTPGCTARSPRRRWLPVQISRYLLYRARSLGFHIYINACV